jgi:hypothetical protein
MKIKPFQYLHPAGIFLILISSRYVIHTLSSTGSFSVSLLPLFMNTLPVTLLMQSVCVNYLANKHKKPGIWIASDIMLVAALQVTTLITLVLSGWAHHQSLTGLFVAVSFILRSIFLIGLTAHTSLRLPEKAIQGTVAVVILCLVVPITSWRIIMRPLSGDEPYYLLMTYSLIHDHDINLENNYLDGDSLTFTETSLSPQLFDNYTNGKLLSRHPPFLAILLIPGFLAARAAGSLLSMTLFASALAIGLIRLLAQFKIPSPQRVWASCLSVLTVPILFYSHAIFAELPAAVLCVFILSICVDFHKIRLFPALFIILLILAAISLKTRFLFLCLPPVLMALILYRKLQKRTWIWIGTITGVIVLAGLSNLFLFGSYLGRYSFQDLTGLSPIRMYRGLAGLFWDQQYGLFPLNILYFFAVPGIYYLLKDYDKSKVAVWASALIPYFFLVAFYAELSGGICPRGRFLVAWIPLLVLPATACFTALRKPFSIFLFTALSVLSLPITALFIAFPDWQISHPGGTDRLSEVLGKYLNMDLSGLIRSFDRVEDNLLSNGLFLSAGVLLLSIMIIIANKLKYPLPCRSPVVSGLCFSLIGLTGGFAALSTIQSPWMHLEDKTFNHFGNATVFWEEPYYWDRLETPSDSPYISGIRLQPGGSIVRNKPLRKPSSLPISTIALELIARSGYPETHTPVLEIMTGNNLLNRIPIRSTEFRRYVVPWPYGISPSVPQLKFLFSSRNHPDTYIDIDKIRLVPWDQPWPEIQPSEHQFLPARFGPLSLLSLDLPEEPVNQGQSFIIQPFFSIDGDLDDLYVEILFIAETRAHLFRLNKSDILGNREIRASIPPEKGAGSFDVLVSVREKNNPAAFIAPEGSYVFHAGNRAWVGNIEVLTMPVKAASGWNRHILDHFSPSHPSIRFLPQTCHLSKNQIVHLGLEEPVRAKKLMIISHLSSVFEQIPWKSSIGSIIMETDNQESTFPVVLGSHTAEAMYEFGGKVVRLSHPQAPIAGRLPETLLWPFEFEGMEYDAVYYKFVYSLDNPATAASLKIQSHEFPGVWNIYSIGLISE